MEGYDPDALYNRWIAFQEIDGDSTLSSSEKASAKIALNEGMSLESWRDLRESLSVNLDRIASKEYAAAVKGAFGDGCGDVALKDVRRMLKHRSGTAFEDLYVYDVTDGKRLDSVVNATREREVLPSERMLSRMAEASGAGHEIAMAHNHPGSSLPSIADLRALRGGGASFGVIACHDCTLLRYQLIEGDERWYNLTDEMLQGAVAARLLRGKSEQEAFAAIEMEWGVRIERFGQS